MIQIPVFVKSWLHQIHGNRISFFPLAWERQCWFFGVSTLGCTHMSRGKPGHCRASLISKHGTSISSCHCIFAPTAPVTAVLRNFPLYHQTAAEGTPLCSSLSYLHIWGRPHHFGRIPPAVNMPRPNKSSFSPVFRKWGTHPPGAPGGRGCSGRTCRPRPSSSARRPLLHTTWS